MDLQLPRRLNDLTESVSEWMDQVGFPELHREDMTEKLTVIVRSECDESHDSEASNTASDLDEGDYNWYLPLVDEEYSE